MAEPFKHKLTSDNLAGIYAHGALLTELLNYLKEVTEFKPEKRYIDAVPLPENIQASGEEITRLLKEAESKLKNQEA